MRRISFQASLRAASASGRVCEMMFGSVALARASSNVISLKWARRSDGPVVCERVRSLLCVYLSAERQLRDLGTFCKDLHINRDTCAEMSFCTQVQTESQFSQCYVCTCVQNGIFVIWITFSKDLRVNRDICGKCRSALKTRVLCVYLSAERRFHDLGHVLQGFTC